MYDETLREQGFAALPTIRPEEVSRRAQTVVSQPWEARCPAHEGESRPGPCVDCAAVRKEAERLRRHEAGRAQAAKQARRDAISSCGMCDYRGLYGAHYPDGQLFMVRCPHEVGELDLVIAEAVAAHGEKVHRPVAEGVGARYGARALEVLEEGRRARAASKASKVPSGVSPRNDI